MDISRDATKAMKDFTETIIEAVRGEARQWEKGWMAHRDGDASPVTREAKLEEALSNYYEEEGIKVKEAEGNASYYCPQTDEIVLPLPEQFKSTADYYATKAHETIHSTGVYVRCNRDGVNGRRAADFGNTRYSREELVAELGANFLMIAMGMDTKQTEANCIAYCQSWLKELQGNPRWIRKASELALEAVEYVLDCTDED